MSGGEYLGQETYLAEGVYARFDGYQIWLLTQDGYRVTNSIALDDTTMAAFDEYRRTLTEKLKSGGRDPLSAGNNC